MASDLAGELMVSSVMVIVVTAVVVWMRMWVRWRLGDLGMDDYMVALSWCFVMAMCSLIIASSRHALGRNRDDVSKEDFEIYLKYSPAISSSFSFGVSLAKISFALLYIRTLPQRFLVFLNKILIGFLIGQAIEEALITILQCSPVEAAYKADMDGKCLDLRVLWWLTFVFNMTTDLILFIQPIPSIWSLRMARAKRLGLVAMMSLGLLVCAISIIRIVYVTRIGDNITRQIAEPLLWSEVELAALLFCSCIPSLRQVIAGIPWLNHAFGLSSNKTSDNRYKPGPKPDGSIPLEAYRRRDYLPSHPSKHYPQGSSGQFGTATQAIATVASNNDSTEEIFPHKTDGNGAILVTREVTHDVEYEGARSHSTDSVGNGQRIEPADRGG